MTATKELPSVETIQLKRQVTVKTKVTGTFKKQASTELAQELKLIDTQLGQLEAQYQQSMQQLEKLAQQGQNVKRQLEQLNQEAQAKRNQLATLKMEVSSQLANMDKVEDGSYIVTGMLENFIDVQVGDNIYEKLRKAEILLEDGVITAIRG